MTCYSRSICWMFIIVFLLLTLAEISPVQENKRDPAAHTNHLFDSNAKTLTNYKNYLRVKRQLDAKVDASYDEEAGGEISAEIVAGLWKSKNGDARLDGTATYSQRFNHYTGNGRPRIAASFHYSHD